MQSKYYDEILDYAESLLHVDANVLDQHHEESGLSFSPPSSSESFEESIDRLHSISQMVFTFLLQLHLPLSPHALSLYRSALLAGRTEVIETGHSCTLTLCMEIARSISWRELLADAPQLEGKFKKACRQLLFESGPSKPEPTRNHLGSILSLWLSLSSKWVCEIVLRVGTPACTRESTWSNTFPSSSPR